MVVEQNLVTPNYLLNHGFMPYNSEKDEKGYEYPFEDNEGNMHFREIEFSRQLFVVIFCFHNFDPSQGYNRDVYVQDDVGCGFVQIPFPWWELTIEYFEAVYYGIRGHKPKFNPIAAEDIPHEVVEAKQLTIKQ